MIFVEVGYYPTCIDPERTKGLSARVRRASAAKDEKQACDDQNPSDTKEVKGANDKVVDASGSEWQAARKPWPVVFAPMPAGIHLSNPFYCLSDNDDDVTEDEEEISEGPDREVRWQFREWASTPRKTTKRKCQRRRGPGEVGKPKHEGKAAKQTADKGTGCEGGGLVDPVLCETVQKKARAIGVAPFLYKEVEKDVLRTADFAQMGAMSLQQLEEAQYSKAREKATIQGEHKESGATEQPLDDQIRMCRLDAELCLLFVVVAERESGKIRVGK